MSNLRLLTYVQQSLFFDTFGAVWCMRNLSKILMKSMNNLQRSQRFMTQARRITPATEVKFADKEVNASLTTAPPSGYLNALTSRAANAISPLMACSINNALPFIGATPMRTRPGPACSEVLTHSLGFMYCQVV